MSADSVIPESSQGVQAWDRYAGMNNNPVRWNDPLGHFINVAIGALLGAAYGVTTLAVNQALNPSVQYTLADVGAALAVGAAAGALISTGVGAGAGTVLGASLIGAGIGAGASAAGYTLGAGAEYTSSEMVVHAGTGAATGAFAGGMNSTLVGQPLAQGLVNGFSNVMQTNMDAEILGQPVNSQSEYSGFGLGLVSGLGSGFSEMANARLSTAPVEPGYMKYGLPITWSVPNPTIYQKFALASSKFAPYMFTSTSTLFGTSTGPTDAPTSTNYPSYLPMICK